MIGQENVPSLVDTSGKKGGASHIGMQALHQTAMSLADFRRGRSNFKTKDLVSLLLTHGARSWRASLPSVMVRLNAFAPNGKPAVKIRLQ